MTRAGLLTAIVVVGLAVAGVAAHAEGPRIPPTGAIKKVKDNLYVIPGAGGNTTVFVTAPASCSSTPSSPTTAKRS